MCCGFDSCRSKFLTFRIVILKFLFFIILGVENVEKNENDENESMDGDIETEIIVTFNYESNSLNVKNSALLLLLF